MADTLAVRRIGETLRAVVEAGALVELHLERDHDRLPVGSVHTAVVREKSGARLRVALGPDEAWLTGTPQLPLGTRLSVRVIRAPVPEPGQVKCAHVVAQHGPAPDVPDPAFVRDFPDTFEVEEWCDRAISGHVPFAGGALTLERTRAGLVIDVDGSTPVPDLNHAAAEKIAAVLRLFQVGGMVMVDFVTPDNRRQRLDLDAALDAALKRDPRPFERTAINGFGMVQIVRARRGPSLIDQLCGTRRGTASVATQALRLLNEAARSRGAGPRRITARPEIADWITRHPSLLDDLRRLTGADVSLLADETAPGAGHVHATPV